MMRDNERLRDGERRHGVFVWLEPSSILMDLHCSS